MSETDLTGRHLGGYRILRKLGQGGMAVVYKAHEESLNRVVALKVIARHLSDNEQFITRFRREAQAAAQLSHPNIVQIHAIGEDGGVHFFAMEYVKGRSLGEIIEEEGFLTAGRAVPIMVQAAEALATAHDAGIVHRDIKPANIMLDAAGRVKVADFGIAQMATDTRMTQSGMLVGTPEFISPEQCHSEKLDGRSDIYSLGVTFYQLLSGRTPFEADTPASLVLQIVEGPIPPVGDLNPMIPEEVQSIVAKMMHVDRDQRFRSAGDLIHALKTVDTGPAAPIPRESPGPGLAPPMGRPPAGSTLAETTRFEDAGATMGEPSVTETVPVAAGPADPQHESTVLAETKPLATAASAATARSSPATRADEGTGGGNRGALLGLAAVALIIVTVSLVGWQLMADSSASEGFDPAVEARPQPLPVRPDDPAPPSDDSARAAAPTGPRSESVPRPGDAVRQQPGGPQPTPADSGPAAATEETVAPAPAADRQRIDASQGPARPTSDDRGGGDGFLPPPVNSIVAETDGEYEYVDQVHAWIERAFGRQDFAVVDYPSSPYESLQQAARFHVFTTVKLVDTQQLAYYGNVQTQYTVAVVSRVTDLSDGVTVAGPETKTIRYTSINMQQNLERGIQELARDLARRLRGVLRRP